MAPCKLARLPYQLALHIDTDTRDNGILTLSKHLPSQSTPGQQQSLVKDNSSGVSYLRVSLEHNSARHSSISDRCERRQLSRSLQTSPALQKLEPRGPEGLQPDLGSREQRQAASATAECSLRRRARQSLMARRCRSRHGCASFRFITMHSPRLSRHRWRASRATLLARLLESPWQAAILRHGAEAVYLCRKLF